jgi:hypothetical protein
MICNAKAYTINMQNLTNNLNYKHIEEKIKYRYMDSLQEKKLLIPQFKRHKDAISPP